MIMLLMIAGGIDNMITRNMIALWIPPRWSWPPVSARAAPGCSASLATMVLCVIGAVAAADRSRSAATSSGPTGGPSPASSACSRPRGPPGRAILIQHSTGLLPLVALSAEAGVRRQAASRRSRSSTSSGSMSPPQRTLCWWGAACNLIPSEMQSPYAARRAHRGRASGTPTSSRSCACAAPARSA